MSFESATLRPVGSHYRPDAVAAWLDAQPFAFEDPHRKGRFWVGASHVDARDAKAKRAADPSTFVPGLVVTVGADEVVLEARADLPTLARGRQLVAALLREGAWSVRRDWLTDEVPLRLEDLFPDDLPDPDEIDGDPTRGDVVLGQRVTWRQGEADAPGGCRWLIVHTSGALSFEHEVDGQPTRRVRADLDPLARLRWLEATAHLDENDDDLGGTPPPERVASVRVESATREWVLYLDVTAPPPTIRPLAALVGEWLPKLDAAETLPEGLGDEP